MIIQMSSNSNDKKLNEILKEYIENLEDYLYSYIITGYAVKNDSNYIKFMSKNNKKYIKKYSKNIEIFKKVENFLDPTKLIVLNKYEENMLKNLIYESFNSVFKRKYNDKYKLEDYKIFIKIIHSISNNNNYYKNYYYNHQNKKISCN